MRRSPFVRISILMVVLLVFKINAYSQVIRSLDLTSTAALVPGAPHHDIRRITANSQGLVVDVDGQDPYFYLKPHDYPANAPLWVRLTFVCPKPGTGRFYYFHHQETESDDVHYDALGGEQVVFLPLPAIGAHTFFRVDPPPGQYTFLLKAVSVEFRTINFAPKWPPSTVPTLGRHPLQIHSGGLQILQAHHELGAFEVNYDGYRMACGQVNEQIGYVFNGKPVFFDPNSEGITTVVLEQGVLHLRTIAIDPNGARWEIHQNFRGRPNESIEVDCSAQVSEPRDLLYLPFFVMLPGLGSFGTQREQALFSGLEYLNNVDPSSSEKDIKGPEALRQIPPAHDITFPLMALAAHNRVISLTWQPQPGISALFDSPDRIFNSPAHLMAVIAPGSVGRGRPPGDILPYMPVHLGPGHVIFANVTVMGARGLTVVPAIKQYVAMHGLPPAPSPGINKNDWLTLASAGWLNSPISHIPRFQHAFMGGKQLPLQVAPDAATEIAYIAANLSAPSLCLPLTAAYRTAMAAVPLPELYTAGIFHVRTAAPPLVAGHALTAAAEAEQLANDELTRLEISPHVIYHSAAGEDDLSVTNPHRYTDGLDAESVLPLLENASFCGDERIIRRSLKILDRLDQYRASVPRGAQTWEVPLHVPDILASADLCKCYALGYMLSGRPSYLQQAEYWAWTGVPFVYLQAPTTAHVGIYATIAVFGASHWNSPGWLGLPVQWCGMVYADALRMLAREDHDDTWTRIADGITACSMQMTWPIGSKLHGLLPDSFNLKTQHRNLPAINPGTAFSGSIRYFHMLPMYDMAVCHRSGAIIHLPGHVHIYNDTTSGVSFHAKGWPVGRYDVLITGVPSLPTVSINGVKVAVENGYRYNASKGWLALKLEGKPTVSVQWRNR